MHKITPQAEKTIQNLVGELPNLHRKNTDGTLMYRNLNKRVIGNELPKSYKEKNDWLPMKYYTYTCQEPVLINHTIGLRDSFVRDGFDGLMHYVNALDKFIKENPKKEIVKEKITLWKSVKNYGVKFKNLFLEIKKLFIFKKK